MKPCPITTSLEVLSHALHGLSAEQRAPLTALFTAWSMAGYVRLIPVLSELLKETHGAQTEQLPTVAQTPAPTLRLIAGTQSGIKPITKPTGKPRVPVRLRLAGVPKSEVAA